MSSSDRCPPLIGRLLTGEPSDLKQCLYRLHYHYQPILSRCHICYHSYSVHVLTPINTAPVKALYIPKTVFLFHVFVSHFRAPDAHRHDRWPHTTSPLRHIHPLGKRPNSHINSTHSTPPFVRQLTSSSIGGSFGY